MSSEVRMMSDFSVFEGGLTDRCPPPVLIDRLLDLVSMLFMLDDAKGCDDNDVTSGAGMHGEVITVDNDRSRRDGGGRPVEDISTWECTRCSEVEGFHPGLILGSVSPLTTTRVGISMPGVSKSG